MQFPWLVQQPPATPSTHFSSKNLAWVALLLAFCFEITSQLKVKPVSQNTSPAQVYENSVQRERFHNAAIFTLLVGLFCMAAVKL